MSFAELEMSRWLLTVRKHSQDVTTVNVVSKE